MAISGDGTTLAWVDENHTVWVWRRGSTAISDQLVNDPDSESIDGISITPDGGLLALTDHVSELLVYKIASNNLLLLADYALLDSFNGNYEANLVFGLDGHSVMLSSDIGVETWLFASDEYRRMFLNCACDDAVLSSNLRTAVVDNAGYVDIWNLHKTTLVNELLAPARISSIALSGNGHILALGTISGLVSIYDLDGGFSSVRLRAATSYIAAVALSASGNKLLVTPEQGRATLWSVRHN